MNYNKEFSDIMAVVRSRMNKIARQYVATKYENRTLGVVDICGQGCCNGYINLIETTFTFYHNNSRVGIKVHVSYDDGGFNKESYYDDVPQNYSYLDHILKIDIAIHHILDGARYDRILKDLDSGYLVINKLVEVDMENVELFECEFCGNKVIDVYSLSYGNLSISDCICEVCYLNENEEEN